MQATYQTRISCDDAALSAYAALHGRVQRNLFAEVSSGRSAASMKRDYVREYGIPARMFNAVRVSLEGKVSGARESQLLHAETLKGLVRRADKELASAGKKGDRHRVHQKMRRLNNLRSRLGARRGRCGGGPGPAVLRRQEALAWPVQPGGQRLRQPCRVAGRLESGAGRRVLCPGQPGRDRRLPVVRGRGCRRRLLTLRLPGCLAGQHGKYLVLEDARFAYGHGQVLAALQANLEFAECRLSVAKGRSRWAMSLPPSASL